MKEGQLRGPFEANVNLFPSGSKIKFGISMDKKDWMPFGNKDIYPFGFYFLLNENKFEIGKTNIYEIDDFIEVNNFIFPFNTPSSVKIDYILNEI